MQFETVNIPEDLRYTNTHLWVKINNGMCTLGWTDYIQANAGDVNYLELAEKGTPVNIDEEFGSIETSKWVDKLYSPINGRVIEVNEKVIVHPEVVNEAPFTDGWFVKVELQGDWSRHLMSSEEYFEYLKDCEVE
jgi:glycine cleavage system H protein